MYRLVCGIVFYSTVILWIRLLLTYFYGIAMLNFLGQEYIFKEKYMKIGNYESRVFT